MTLEDNVDDMMIILNGSKISDDTDIEKEHLAHKFNNYRAMYINELYRKTREINPVWLQRLPIFDFTKINSADEPSMVSSTSICMGKYTLPPVVELPGDLGMYRINATSRQKQIYPTDEQSFFAMIECDDPRVELHIFYFKLLNSVFIYPYLEQGSGVLIYENPLDGVVFQTEKVVSGNVVSGTSYTVFGAQIQYNAIIYNIGDTVTGVAGVSVYTGNGYLKHTSETRAMTYTDPYPIDRSMAQRCVIDVMVKDFGIERKAITDIVNDSQEQFKVLQTQG